MRWFGIEDDMSSAGWVLGVLEALGHPFYKKVRYI